ncbi:MAG TPA: alpha/beta hydrolase-fold protein [Puia sp.]|nr:alpha/beta hydrolase-fold protein [Puia sp.]
MEIQKSRTNLKETIQIVSEPLERSVQTDFYLPARSVHSEAISLLLINDGQDLEKMGFQSILNDLYDQGLIGPLLCVGIHAGADRKMEYGTSIVTDYKGRGAKAIQYAQFIFEELLPAIRKKYSMAEFKEKAFAGFSLGALSALDNVWNHPREFSKVGVFSGSLWWRTKDKNDASYNDATDRIMHQLIKNGQYHPWLKFFFECGGADEGEDRNNNGVIDSIDDTLDLIEELKAKGYRDPENIHFMLIEDGRHDIATWARALPAFLRWGWPLEI